MNISLRVANLSDLEVLFANRNDPVTRRNSHDSLPIDFKIHQRWFTQALQNPNRRLFILEVDGSPVATSRLDENLDAVMMSWSVFPEYRGHGYGKTLLTETLKEAIGLVRAEVKSENVASKKIAEHVGFSLVREENGVCYYEIVRLLY